MANSRSWAVDRRSFVGSLAAAALPVAARAAPINANDFGARGDGRTLSTKAIQAAIDRAALHGGRVRLAPGTYLTGALFVKSGVTLELGRGVTLLGSRNLSDYPFLPTRVAGIEAVWPAALVNVYRQRNASIIGEGVIDGDGKVWWDAYWQLRARYTPRGLRWAADYDCARPRLVQIFGSSNVSVGDGLLLRRSGFWTVHICYSYDVRVADVTIRNNEDGRGPSTDGIDIDSSRRVRIDRADIACNDDGLCIKAGRDADGLRVNRPTSDVVIRDCIVRDAVSGIAFGSETSGGFHDILVERLRVLAPTPSGILFKSARTRGGHGRRVVIRDVDMRGMRTAVRIDWNWNPAYSYARIPADVANPPALWRTLAQPVPPEIGLAKLEQVAISGIRSTDTHQAFDVAAYPQSTLDHFRFDDIAIDAPDGGKIADARDWRFTRTHLKAEPVLSNVEGLTGL